MTRHHWNCVYLFFQTLKSHLPCINIIDQQTITRSWKGCHRMTRLQPRKKKKSEKKINDSSQRGHNIYKWNFHNFQTPEFCPILKKIKIYPFEHWETVWSLLCQFKKQHELKALGRNFDKIGQTKVHFKSSGLLFFLW